MPLPEPRLDDLRFQQDLVDEARRRIIRYCPEWTDYNLSDPGITLIELFAWMTEQLTYRLNRVPEKNYLHFLNLLGVQLQPASSARVALTFRLSTLLPISATDNTLVTVPANTEVATRPGDGMVPLTFTTDAKLVISPPVLTEVRRAEEFQKNYLTRLQQGVEVFPVFNARRPQVGDTFYLGFAPDHNLSGHVLQLRFLTEETEGTGIKRSDPPLVWEVAQGNGQWVEVKPSQMVGETDTTGGLNNAEGTVTFYLPLDLQPDIVNGRSAYWLRCRLQPRDQEHGLYQQTPRVRNVLVATAGATTRATHAVIIAEEILGQSDGEPGQRFRLAQAPVLALQPGETVEVEEKRDGELVFVPWDYVADFATATRYDRCFSLDHATGELAFGPCVRQADGNMRQYGRVPEAGRLIRFSRYRHGGGAVGNVPPGRLEVLQTAVPYIDRVTNLTHATGGRDQEDLEEAKLRARRDLHAQQRAVTAEDFENLALGASRSVARAKCLAPGSTGQNLPPGMVEVVLIPAVAEALRLGNRGALQLEMPLSRVVQAHLDQFRLLTTAVRLREPLYLGVQVKVEVVPLPHLNPETVQQRVLERLRAYLSPLAIGDEAYFTTLTSAPWTGWPFGRALYQSELYTVLQSVPGVKHVLDVQVSQRRVLPAQEKQAASSGTAAEAPALTPVPQRRLDLPADGVFCSLDHDVRMVEM